MPSAFVSTNACPARPRRLLNTSASATSPVTASPNFGSGSRTLCPPTTRAPARAHARAPPARIARSTARGSRSSGKNTRFSAHSGRPPIAYTSDSALQAAISPNTSGSSTIGAMTSVVSTSPRPSFSSRRTTAASSANSAPTITSDRPSPCPGGSTPSSTWTRSPSRSFAAQPPPRASCVNRGCKPSSFVSVIAGECTPAC